MGKRSQNYWMVVGHRRGADLCFGESGLPQRVCPGEEENSRRCLVGRPGHMEVVAMVTVCQICLAAERTRGSQIPPGEEVVIAVVFVLLETVTLFASLLSTMFL